MEGNKNLEKYGAVIVQVAVAIVVGAASIWAVSLFVPKQTMEPVSSVISDNDAKDKMHSLVLIKPEDNFTNSVIRNETGRNVPDKSFEKELKVTGTIVGGYLYVVGDVDGKSFDTNYSSNYDDVFVNLIKLALNEGDSVNHEGHLVESRSLKTDQYPNKTALLYSLSNIPVIIDYLSQDNEVSSLNWLPVLREGVSLRIDTFVSTYMKTSGRIDKFVIYYECLENTLCSIEAK